MANRFPLIFNSGAGQIQELAASDNLDLTSSNLVNAGILFTSSGSATAPSLQIGSGTTYNPGLYSPGTDQLAVATNGTGRVFVDASGRVGVGVAPSAPLEVNGEVRFTRSGVASQYVGVIADGTDTRIFAEGSSKNLSIKNNSTTSSAILFDQAVASSYIFNQAGNERARIRADGTFEIKGAGTAGTSPAFSVNPSTPANSFVIDSSGRLLIGMSSARGGFDNNSGVSSNLQVEGAGTAAGGTRTALSIVNNGNADADSAGLYLARSGGTAVSSFTAVTVDDALGRITFSGADGTEFVAGASIEAVVDGTPGANDMPGRLVFSTTADGGSSPTERMRITSGGILSNKTTNIGSEVGQGWSLSAGGEGVFTVPNPCLYVNRLTTDGTLVAFFQDNTQEGTISVSGTTVSYNGAHLSRWSQLEGTDEHDINSRPEILRGTVLSNIDEMCEWGEEDNEQLNRMKVSTVEGDKNVSGVFQTWDDDDDTYINDFYCAMTGDFIIRIAEGITIERGDLLMSAGDGTAKPQDDDIIRSKTIAKVTSTNVSCTYEDGSYCVPCVLMAC